jgi:osmotically-inducible protein OsmY
MNQMMLSLIAGAGLLAAQQAPLPSPEEEVKTVSEYPKTQTPRSVLRMAEQIRKEIVTLPNYGVFDNLSYSIKDYTVTLKGQASRPTLKDSVERVVKKVEGVEKVINQIEVLPLSNFDDRIRARVYAAIYFDPSLSIYNPNRGGPMWITPSRIAAGITNDPPIGNHPIHIIVNNGNVVLTGVVNNEMDRDIAGIRANTVQGVFSVDNQIQAAQAAKPKKQKK